MNFNYQKSLTIFAFLGGIIVGTQTVAMTKRDAPDAHQGISAASLGVVDAESMKNTLGLEGYKLQLREIGLAPGGRIAKHSHSNRPGLVWMLEGSWTEGRENGEVMISAGTEQSYLVEDENTTHWFFNDTDKAARAIVCDIVPE